MELKVKMSSKLIKAAEKYGSRIARKELLKIYCQNNHPVLEIEYKLIKMAEENLVKVMQVHNSKLSDIIFEIRKAAVSSIHELDEEDQVKNLVSGLIMNMPMEEILPRFN